MSRYTVEIDCAPGMIRPGDLFPGVLSGTPLTEEDFTEVSRWFGNWTWAVKPGKEEVYVEHRNTVQRRIIALYDSGQIRYGSW